MAFIRYVTDQELPSADRVPDSDNILQIHGVHPHVMHQHYQLYRTMLDYAEKLTRTPASIRAADIDRLRAVGFDDRAIHDLGAIVAYFGFVNRIADGLGVELEQPQSPTEDGI